MKSLLVLQLHVHTSLVGGAGFYSVEFVLCDVVDKVFCGSLSFLLCTANGEYF